MAKKDEMVPEKPTQKQEVANVEQSTITNEQAAKVLQSAEVGEQDSGYLNFNPGDKKRVVFKGTKQIPSLDKSKPGETVSAMIFVTDTGKEQINADAAIRSYFEKQPIGVAREIVCTGLTKGPKGDYKTFQFFELNFKK